MICSFPGTVTSHFLIFSRIPLIPSLFFGHSFFILFSLYQFVYLHVCIYFLYKLFYLSFIFVLFVDDLFVLFFLGEVLVLIDVLMFCHLQWWDVTHVWSVCSHLLGTPPSLLLPSTLSPSFPSLNFLPFLQFFSSLYSLSIPLSILLNWVNG